ncbi:helix-turn-helix domain-containing protein [Tautonia plasticadhaerens]|uniref:helix-turn-helix domain-containing protein n=1 Tax=Tautonia plasticadhaerens TaxID=2527974 RepID=UPI0018D2219D
MEVSNATLERVRLWFVEWGLEAALVREERARPSRERALDGRAEARLIALACSQPPDGRKAWTMRLPADTLVELEFVPSISDETVRRSLKEATWSRTPRSDGASRRGRMPSSWRRWGTCWTPRLPPALRWGAASGLPRRGSQASDRRGPRADPGRDELTRAVRLRVRT